jgi:GntR family transcriptional regulator
MIFQVNYKSGKPIYLQVVDQVKAAAASGELSAGEALPSIRPLAEELRVNRNTIAKAYSELENLGLVETQPGRGCFLKQNHSAMRKQARLKLLEQEVDQVIVQAHHLRVERGEFLELVEQRMDALDDKRRANQDNRED